MYTFQGGAGLLARLCPMRDKSLGDHFQQCKPRQVMDVMGKYDSSFAGSLLCCTMR